MLSRFDPESCLTFTGAEKWTTCVVWLTIKSTIKFYLILQVGRVTVIACSLIIAVAVYWEEGRWLRLT